MKQGRYTVAVFDIESDSWLTLARGTKKECTEIAHKLAALGEGGKEVVGFKSVQEGDFGNDSFDLSFTVAPSKEFREFVGEEQLQDTVVQESVSNSYYGESRVIGFLYEEPEEDGGEPIGFEPTGETTFKPGDTVIFVGFIGNNPGAWMVTDETFTKWEYWQCAPYCDYDQEPPSGW